MHWPEPSVFRYNGAKKPTSISLVRLCDVDFTLRLPENRLRHSHCTTHRRFPD